MAKTTVAAPIANSIPQLNAIMPHASTLALKGITLFRRQSLMAGPNDRCSSSQLANAGEPLLAKNAASKTKGVVGNKGNTTPMAAKPMDIYARTLKPVFPGRTVIAGTSALLNLSPILPFISEQVFPSDLKTPTERRRIF